MLQETPVLIAQIPESNEHVEQKMDFREMFFIFFISFYCTTSLITNYKYT